MTRSESTSTDVWIIGAGGFGREALDAALAAGQAVAGFVDHAAGGPVRGLPVRSEVPPGAAACVAVADPSTRARLVDEFDLHPEAWATIVHPTCVRSPEVHVGAGGVLLAQSFVSSSVHLGEHVHVNYFVSIGHDTVVGRCSTLLPGARVAGDVTVGERCLIGSSATVLQGLEIGDGAIVGAGAVVTRDVLPGATVVGVPARPR